MNRPDVFFIGWTTVATIEAAQKYALNRGLVITGIRRRFIKGSNCFFLSTIQSINTLNFCKMSKIKVCLTFSEYNNPMQIYEAEMMGTYRDGAGVETVVFFRDGADECEHLPIEHIQEFLFADKWIKANFEL